MSDKPKLDHLNVGDIVRTVRTHEVVKVDPEYVRIKDVQNNYEFYVGREVDHGSLKIEVVKKAPDASYWQTPAKVGDVILAEDITKFEWSVGSVLTADGYVYLLGANGWHSPDMKGEKDILFPTDDLCRHALKFKVIHLP